MKRWLAKQLWKLPIVIGKDIRGWHKLYILGDTYFDYSAWCFIPECIYLFLQAGLDDLLQDHILSYYSHS
jgi:hypothetical protein